MLMKKNFLSVVFLSLCLFEGSLPVNGENTQLDYVLTYDGSGSVAAKTTYVYDDLSRMTERWVYKVVDGELTYNEKELFGYDDLSRQVSYENWIWDDASMAFIGNYLREDSKYSSVYGDDGKEQSRSYYAWNRETERWDETPKTTSVFTYDGNMSTEEQLRTYPDGSQKTVKKIECVYDENNRVVERIPYNYSFDFSAGDYVWKMTGKTTYAYDDHGSVIEEAEYGESLNLMYKYKREFTYDDKGNKLSMTEWTWRDALGDYEQTNYLTYVNHYVSGERLELPYVNTFDDETALDDCTVEDGNADGNVFALNGGSLQWTSSKKSEAPDILYTPGLHMSPDQEVRVSLKARVADASKLSQIMLILCSNDEAHTPMGAIGDIRVIDNTEYVEVEGFIIVPSEGNYCIGLSADNNQIGSVLTVDDLEVSNYRSAKTPQSPYNLTAVPGNAGALAVRLEWYAPVYCIDGSYLNKVDKMEVYRKGETEPAYTTGEVGGTLRSEWIDYEPVKGVNTYLIYAYSNGLKSDPSEVSVVVGYSRPGAVKNFTVVEDNAHNCVLTWDAPEAADEGGELYDGTMTYTIVRNNETIVAENITETTFVDNTIDTSFGQTYVFYTITPSYEAGIGSSAYSDLMFVGPSSPVPFAESFVGGGMAHWWMNEKVVGLESAWGIGDRGYTPDALPQDGDGGMASFMNEQVDNAGDIVRFTSEKIDVSPLNDPELSFYVYHTSGAASDDALIVEASKDNGAFEEISAPIKVSGAETDGWAKHTVSLAAFQGEKNLRLSFKGIAGKVNNIHLDNITVAEGEQGSVCSLELSDISVRGGDGEVIVSAVEPLDVTVYNVGGQIVAKDCGNDLRIPVAAGLYVVRAGGFVYKVAVK